jgi:serine/threonine-protein kinase
MKRLLLSVLPILVLAVLIIGCPKKEEEKVIAPNLLSTTIDGARLIAENAGLLLVVTGEEESDRAPQGLIFKQTPMAGSVLKRGSSVNVIVSKGPGPVVRVIPVLKGMTVTDAAAALEKLGLKLGTVDSVYSDQVAASAVVESDPPRGTEVAVGATVDLMVSTGRTPVPAPKVTVPRLIGIRLGRAKAMLRNLGLEVGDVSYQVTTEWYEGNVIGQRPAAGTEVPKGSLVSLVVSAVLY